MADAPACAAVMAPDAESLVGDTACYITHTVDLQGEVTLSVREGAEYDRLGQSFVGESKGL